MHEFMNRYAQCRYYKYLLKERKASKNWYLKTFEEAIGSQNMTYLESVQIELFENLFVFELSAKLSN